jgi:hypothetical protein
MLDTAIAKSFYCVLFYICIIVIIFFFVISNNVTKDRFLRDQDQITTRLLAAIVDPATGDPVVTYDGAFPMTSCPIGSYRPNRGVLPTSLVGPRTDGCVACPRGI